MVYSLNHCLLPRVRHSSTLNRNSHSPSLFGTAYFHQANANGECPNDFTRIKCRCRNAAGAIEEVWVCYTMDHDVFQRWYDAQRWDDRSGEYRLGSLNIAGGVPDQIPCATSLILSRFGVKVVPNCADYSLGQLPMTTPFSGKSSRSFAMPLPASVAMANASRVIRRPGAVGNARRSATRSMQGRPCSGRSSALNDHLPIPSTGSSGL